MILKSFIKLNLVAFVTIVSLTFTPFRDIEVLSNKSRTQPAVITIESSKMRFREIVSGFTQPLVITHAGDNSGRLFIVERAGYIYIVKNGTKQSTPA